MGKPHGETKTKLYNSWRGMLSRCRSHSGDHAKWYSRAGVTVTPEWESFPAFREWARANGYEEGLTIDRIDAAGNYDPTNCRWVNRKTQGENKRRACFVTIDGETLNVLDWSKKTGIVFSTLYKRFKKGVRGHEFIEPPLKWDSTQYPAVKVRQRG